MFKFKPPRAFQESVPFIQKFSKTLSRALVYLLWTPANNKYLQYMFLLASNLQYILILLWIQLTLFHSELKNGLASSILSICEFLLLKNIYEAKMNFLLIFMYVYFVTVLSGIYFLGSQIARSRMISVNMKKFIMIISQFHISIAF